MFNLCICGIYWLHNCWNLFCRRYTNIDNYNLFVYSLIPINQITRYKTELLNSARHFEVWYKNIVKTDITRTTRYRQYILNILQYKVRFYSLVFGLFRFGVGFRFKDTVIKSTLSILFWSMVIILIDSDRILNKIQFVLTLLEFTLHIYIWDWPE